MNPALTRTTSSSPTDETAWTGVRNFAARNNLRAMKKGDLCLFYHSNEGKAVVGVARVVREAYQDPTQESAREDWSAVDVAARARAEAPGDARGDAGRTRSSAR